MFRFTIRDVLWLTALAALSIAWYCDRSRLLREVAQESRVEGIVALEDYGAAVLYDDQFGQAAKPPVGTKDRAVYMVGFNPGEFERKALPHLKALPELQCLVIQEPRLDDSVIEDVSVLIQLRELELPSCGITDEGARKLVALVNIQKLGLSGNPLGDDGTQALTTLNALKEVDLSGTNITGRGVEELLGRSRSIRKIVLERCQGIGKDELATLRGKFGGVEIFD